MRVAKEVTPRKTIGVRELIKNAKWIINKAKNVAEEKDASARSERNGRERGEGSGRRERGKKGEEENDKERNEEG